MKVTRNVVLDLLPLYVADEVSDDSRHIVEAFLETDTELRELAQKSTLPEYLKDIPIPLSQEDKMKAYLEAKRLMFWRTVVLAITITIIILTVLGMTTLVAARVFF